MTIKATRNRETGQYAIVLEHKGTTLTVPLPTGEVSTTEVEAIANNLRIHARRLGGPR